MQARGDAGLGVVARDRRAAAKKAPYGWESLRVGCTQKWRLMKSDFVLRQKGQSPRRDAVAPVKAPGRSRSRESAQVAAATAAQSARSERAELALEQGVEQMVYVGKPVLPASLPLAAMTANVPGAAISAASNVPERWQHYLRTCDQWPQRTLREHEEQSYS
jgi:hypothetical protein